MGTVFRYSHAIDFGDAATKLAHQAECQRCGLILEAAAVSRQPKDSVSGEDPERSSDKLFACITNRRTCCISNNARPRSCWSTRLPMNFPRGISAPFAQFGSCFPVDRADKLIAKIYPAASMDVTPIALEVCGTCSQFPWESTLRPPSRRSMWSLRRPPQ
jgi:hypothetical protein